MRATRSFTARFCGRLVRDSEHVASAEANRPRRMDQPVVAGYRLRRQRQDALVQVEHVTLGLNAGTKVPEDAKLRLTIQEDCKTRVPFAIKDIPIPKIDKGIDIPASREEAFIEAAAIGPGDPIFAGLKFQAEAGWRLEFGACSISSKQGEPMRRCKAYQFVLPDLTLTLQGKPADLTTAYGEVDIVSASDEKGNPLDVFPDTIGEIKKRSFDDRNPTVKFTLAPSRAPHRIRELRHVGPANQRSVKRCRHQEPAQKN